ncbi:MAG: hypothetical protein ACI85Q_000642 [Salibacteraceae bacterium]
MKKSVIWISLLVVTVLTFIAIFLFNNAQDIANGIIRDEIIKKYNKNPDTQYQISIGEINLNIISGSIQLKMVKVQPKDSLVVLEHSLDGLLISNTFFQLSIAEIALTGFDILDALNNRVVRAKKFKIDQPIIEIYHHIGFSPEQQKTQDTVDFRNIFLANYDLLHLNEVIIKNVSTTYYDINTLNDTSEIFTITNLSYQLKELKANKKTLYTDAIFEVEEYILDSRNIQVKLKNNAEISVKSIHFNSQNKNLEINEFYYHPGTSPNVFLKELKYKKGWVDFKAKKITLSNININKWFTNKELYTNSLEINQPKLNIYTKEDLPMEPKQVKPMLGEMIMQLPIPFLIEHAFIKEAEIKLDITGKMTPIHGKLRFHKMNIEATNLTNISHEIALNPYLDIISNTKINNTGNIKSKLKINLESSSSLSEFSVHVKELNFKNFNSILVPIVRVSLIDGKMIDLKINSTLSSHGAFGTMDAHYTSLKLQLESKDGTKKPGIFNNVASGIANGIIKTENIPGTADYHQGHFKFKKTKHTSFFQMLWLITLNGLEDSILGSDSKDERKKRKKEKRKSTTNKVFNF